jgi:hypothetical protein
MQGGLVPVQLAVVPKPSEFETSESEFGLSKTEME